MKPCKAWHRGGCRSIRLRSQTVGYFFRIPSTAVVLLDQLDLIKGLLANKFPHLSLAELFAEMAKLSLEKLRPKAPKPAEPSKPKNLVMTVPTKTQSKVDASEKKSGAGVGAGITHGLYLL